MTTPRQTFSAFVVCLSLGLLIIHSASLKGQNVTFTPVGSISGPIDLVEAEGTLAFITVSETLTIFDIRNPAAPTRKGSHVFSEKIWGLDVVGSLVYVAAGHSGLWIVDVTDPNRPNLISSIKPPGQAKNVAVSGSRAVVADHMSGIDVIDISDLTHPVSVGSVYTDGYARDVAMFGTRAYGVDHPAGFYVLDMTAADPLEPVGMLQTASAPRHVDIMEATPDIAVLVGGVPYDPLRALRTQPRNDDPSGTLQLYDVSEQESPLLITTFSTLGDAQRARLAQTYAYVADGPAGLTVVDLSDPSNPEIIGNYQTRNSARDVAVSDTAVLIIDGTIRRGSHGHEDGDVIILQELRN